MKAAIDLSDAVNPARHGALRHAHYRAKRERRAMRVYVAPPDSAQVLSPNKFNVWYVRRADEAAPEGAELFEEVTP